MKKKGAGRRALTFSHHAHVETLHEATGLAGLAPPLGDLTLIGGRTAVLYIACGETCWAEDTRRGFILDRQIY